MRGWYNIHKHDTLEMGFAPFVGSAKSAPVLATTTPSTAIPSTSFAGITSILGIDITAFLWILGATTAITASVMLLIIYCAKYAYAAKSKLAAAPSQKKSVASSENESAISLIYL